MSVLSNFLKKTAPIVAAVAPGTPIGTVAQVKTIQDAQAQQRFLRNTQIEAYEQQKRNNTMALDPSQMIGQRSSVISATQPQLGFFDRLSNLGSQVGNTLLTGLESAVPSVINRAIFGRGTTTTATQGPAVTTTTNVGAQESQGSGTIEAGAGAFLPSLISGARNLLKTPGGQLALGGGGALLGSMIGPDGKKMRITRKMKSQARTVLNIAQGNISVAADILNISEEMLITILLKRFRNDGPVVTKAALRKTKSTIRRLHNMQDVLKSITPTAAGRRRAPIKRSMSTTLIKN